MDAETTRYLVRLGKCNVWSPRVINNKLSLAQEAFAEFDKNNTGTINQKVTDICHMNMIINLFTWQELTAVLRCMGQNPTDSQVNDMVNEVAVLWR